MELINPYSAEHPVPPSKFAGRYKEIQEFTRFLEETHGGNSKNLALLGEWGIGKTSLLRKFKELADTKGMVSIIIELGEAIDTLPLLFEIITRSFADEAQKTKKTTLRVREFLENLSLSVNYGPFGISSQRKDPHPNVLKFKKDIISIREYIKVPFVIMLDNAEQLLRIKGSLMELRNIFQTIQSMEEINCMLILAGKAQLFSGIREAYEPAARFFWSIEVPPFDYPETKEAIEIPLKKQPVKFTEALIKTIHKLTIGHPYFVQLFAYNLYNIRKSKVINENDLEKNYTEMFDFLGKRLFESSLDTISLKEKELLLKLAKIKGGVFSNAQAQRMVKFRGINQYLKRLGELESAILLKAGWGEYKFYHPLFKEYLRQIQKV